MSKPNKKFILCELGLHKFESISKTDGYVDVGNIRLRHEETQVVCIRCQKVKSRKNAKWVEFEKKE